MNAPLNPYAEWLQIGGDVSAPDHYQLLGIARFEDDPERIRGGYWERFALVRQYEVGAYTEIALRLLDELSQAFHCLSDPALKRQYDSQLGRKLTPAALTDDDVLDFLGEAPATDAADSQLEEETTCDFDLPPVSSSAAIPDAAVEDPRGKSPAADEIDVVAAELVEEAARAQGHKPSQKLPALRSRLRTLLENSIEKEAQLPKPGWVLRAPAHPQRRERSANEPHKSPAPGVSSASPASETRGRIIAHREAPCAMAWSPRGDWLATSGDEGRVRIWVARTGEHHHDVPLAQIATIDELVWSADGRLLLLRDGRRISGVWDAAEQRTPEECRALPGVRSPAAWNPATGRLAFVRDGALCLAVSDGWARIPLDPQFTVTSLAFSPDGVQIAIGFSGVSPKWGISIRPLAQLVADRFGVTAGDSAPIAIETPGAVEYLAMRAGPAASLYIAARLEQQVRVFRMDQGPAAREAAAIGAPEYLGGRDVSVAWSIDGRRLAWIDGGDVCLCDVSQPAAGKSRLPLKLSALPTVVAFAPDGVHLAVGDAAGTVKVWSCDRKREQSSFAGKSAVLQLDWRRTSRRVAALHADGEVAVWDLPSVSRSSHRAQAAGAVPAKLDLLRVCVATEAWEEYHRQLCDLGSLSLNPRQKKLLDALKVEVKERTESALKAALDPKSKPAVTNPPFYQLQLKRVVAMDRGAEYPHAAKLLEESIRKHGSLSEKS